MCGYYVTKLILWRGQIHLHTDRIKIGHCLCILSLHTSRWLPLLQSADNIYIIQILHRSIQGFRPCYTTMVAYLKSQTFYVEKFAATWLCCPTASLAVQST